MSMQKDAEKSIPASDAKKGKIRKIQAVKNMLGKVVRKNDATGMQDMYFWYFYLSG